MSATPSPAFEGVPATAGGHFVLHLYAAIYQLVRHIHRLSEGGGTSLEQIFERYPFLADYFVEMRAHMPEDLTWEEASAWWQREIAAFENRCESHLPFARLGNATDELDFWGRLAFTLTGLVEEDSRFGTLFAELQEPLGHRRPTLELVGQMMLGEVQAGERDAWTLCRPMLENGLLLAAGQENPRSEWLLRAPALLWDAARGAVPERPAEGIRVHSPEVFPKIEELILPAKLRHRLTRLPALLAAGKVDAVVLRGDPGCDAVEVHGALARALGRGLVILRDGVLESKEEAWRLLGPLCAMTRSYPVLTCDPGPGEIAEPPRLTGYPGPVGFVLGLEGGLGGAAEGQITLTLPPPSPELRRRHWLRSLEEQGSAVPDDLETIVERFHLSGGYIRRVGRRAVAHARLECHGVVELEDVRQASRSLNRQLLDSLADRLEARGSWEDLVTAETTGDKLGELEQRCRHRERLLAHLGPAFGNVSNRGVRALFTGVSGTGKTLAARILAAELGADLYRVDLASVINKYIGETEKNLHRVLSRAEALDVVLLLDEGDALLGRRTEVRGANDRYANLETNYLLQRLEHYQGVVLVTTNLGDNIDPGFQRRMDVVVPFFLPQAEERWRILEMHLPVDHRVDAGFLQRIARRCALTGGQLRNAALHAALLALDGGGVPLADAHLHRALRSEYRKAGGTFPLTELDGGAGSHPARSGNGRLESFIAAFGDN